MSRETATTALMDVHKRKVDRRFEKSGTNARLMAAKVKMAGCENHKPIAAIALVRRNRRVGDVISLLINAAQRRATATSTSPLYCLTSTECQMSFSEQAKSATTM